MTQGLSQERIAELKTMGYDVHAVSDQAPCIYGWLHNSGASQFDVRDRQPYRLSAAQAWDDCDAYDRARIPSVANPDWMTK